MAACQVSRFARLACLRGQPRPACPKFAQRERPVRPASRPARSASPSCKPLFCATNLLAWQVSRETYAQCAFLDESSLFVARIPPNVFIFTLKWQKGAQTYENRRDFSLKAYVTAKSCHEPLEFREIASKSYARRKFCHCLVLWLGRAPLIRVDFFSRARNPLRISQAGTSRYPSQNLHAL